MKKIAHVTSVIAMIVAADLSFPHTSWAQDLPSADAGAADAEGDAIYVTARHRQENIQDIPVSVTALDQAQLEAASVNSLRDMTHLLPGVQFTERGSLSTQLTIRGVGGDSRNIGIEAGVGMYIDGVYVPRTSGYNSDLADIARVEVLRGPQGTLFGKNTIGGVVNIISKDPTDVTEGSAYVSYGNYNALRTQAVVSGPLADNLYGKITIATFDRDGYIHNLYNDKYVNDENRRGGKLQLVYLPSDALTIKLSADATYDRRTALQTQMDSPKGAAAPYYTGNRFEANTDKPNDDRRDMWGTSLTAEYALPNQMTITSISAYRKVNVTVSSDIDQLPINIFNSDPLTDFVQMASQELRLTSGGSGPLSFVGGLYYYHQYGTMLRDIYIQGSLANGIYDEGKAVTDSYAAYFNADYEVLPGLTATGGLRYTYEKKSADFYQERGPSLSYDFRDMRRSDSNVSWTGSLTYKPTSAVTAYATVSKGFKSGGFNLDTIGAANLTPDDLTFGPESVINYEIGIKGHMLDHMLRYSLSVFQMDYGDKQVAQLVTTAVSSVPSVQVTNAGKAKIRGFELEATLEPAAGLTFSANASYLDAKYTQFDYSAQGSSTPVSYTGNRIEFTPEWALGGQADYRVPMGDGEFFLNGTVKYTGDMYLQPDGASQFYEPGYALFDSRIGYETGGGVTIALWGKNLSNAAYRTYARIFGGLDQAVWGEPRTFGIEARYKF